MHVIINIGLSALLYNDIANPVGVSFHGYVEYGCLGWDTCLHEICKTLRIAKIET